MGHWTRHGASGSPLPPFAVAARGAASAAGRVVAVSWDGRSSRFVAGAESVVEGGPSTVFLTAGCCVTTGGGEAEVVGSGDEGAASRGGAVRS